VEKWNWRGFGWSVGVATHGGGVGGVKVEYAFKKRCVGPRPGGGGTVSQGRL